MSGLQFPTLPPAPSAPPAATYPQFTGSAVLGFTANSLLYAVSANTLNRSSQSMTKSQQTIGGTNSLLPLVYGQQRIGGRIFALKVKTTTKHLVIGVAWCHGEVDSVVSVTINDIALPASITVDHYTGTSTQTASTKLSGAISGYTDTLHGVCYSVFDIPPSVITGFPRFAAVIKGQKVSATSGGAKSWSQNPAYILADFIENTTYGMGRAVDWASVASVASACDTLVGGEKKRLLNLVMDQALPGEQWLQVLRDYAGCFVVPDGGSYRLVADTTGSSVYSFTSANIVADSLRLTKLGTSEQPTMIEVVYTDTSVTPYREARYQTTDATPRRVSRISKPGITRHSEAVRYAIERLNAATLCDLSATFDAFDAALAVQVGDIIDITHPIGLSAKEMRVMRIDPVSPGRWRITAVEYDPAVYDSSVATAPTTPDTSTPNASDSTVVVSSVVWTEVREQTAGGLWTTRLKATWTAPAGWPYVGSYEVQHALEASYYLQQFTIDVVPGEEWMSPPLQNGDKVYIRVRPISVTGTFGTFLVDTHTVTSVNGVAIGLSAQTPPATLSVATSTAKATASTTTATTIGSGDTSGTSDLALNVRLGGSATQSARWTGLQSYENGYGNQTLALNDLGGPVVVGATSAPSGTVLKVIGGSINLDEEVRNRAIGFNVDNTFTHDGSTVAHYGMTWQPSSTSYGVGLSGYGALEFFTAGVQRAVFDNNGYLNIHCRTAFKFQVKNGAPSTSDIPDGYAGVWKDSGAGTAYLYVNDGGTLKKVQLT